MPSESLQKTWSNFGRLNTVEIQSMSGPSFSRCFRVWDVCVSIFFFMSIHVTRDSSLLAFPRMKPANWLNPIFAWELILVFPFATCHTCHYDLDQGVDADPAKSWGPWKHAVWRTEDIAEASNLVDLLYYLFAFVDHFRTRLDQSMAKKANAAAEGLCKFVFWTAKRCEFKKSHTCDRDVMSPLSKL